MTSAMWRLFLPLALLVGMAQVFSKPHDYNFQAIYPGTNFCGTGNVSRHYDDLGMLRELDMCCRGHDSCDDQLNPGQERGGLTNNGFIPMFPCRCEDRFRKCLQEVDKFWWDANLVGSAYFDVATPGCYVDEEGSGRLQLVKAAPFKACIKMRLFDLCRPGKKRR